MVTDDLSEQRVAVLETFTGAWNRHDLDALMACMDEDCVFRGAAGELIVGSEYRGLESVRVGYAKIFELFPDACWNDSSHFVSGERGVSEWRFTGTRADGVQVETAGCDLFEFAGDKIRVKDSYRKQRS